MFCVRWEDFIDNTDLHINKVYKIRVKLMSIMFIREYR